MLLYILPVISIVIAIILWKVHKRTEKFEIPFLITFVISVVLTVVVPIVHIGSYQEFTRFEAKYELQRHYFKCANQNTTLVSISQANEELFNYQATYLTYGNWTFIPSRVMNIVPIGTSPNEVMNIEPIVISQDT